MMTTETNQINEAESVDAARAFGLLSISRVTGWRLMNNPDSGFPRPYRCDPTNPRSRLRFRVCELIRWIQKQEKLTAEASHVGIRANKADRNERVGVTE
jgi:predicted DNA-binding transcriptional regulator AlpA